MTKKEKEERNRFLEEIVRVEVKRACFLAKIPLEIGINCKREKFSDVEVTLRVKGKKYVREINKRSRRIA